MWIPSIAPPNLSLIGSLTMEIYYRTEITGIAHRQTYTQTEFDIFPVE